MGKSFYTVVYIATCQVHTVIFIPNGQLLYVSCLFFVWASPKFVWNYHSERYNRCQNLLQKCRVDSLFCRDQAIGSMSEYRACSIRDYYKHCSMISNSVRGRVRWWCAVSLVVFNCMTWWHADARKSVSINNFHELLLCSDAIIIVFENTCTKLRPRFGPVRLCH